MKKAPGFAAGAGTLVAAMSELRRDRALWPAASVPAAVFLGLLLLALLAAGQWLLPALTQWLGLAELSSWYGRASKFVVMLLLWIAAAVLSLWVSLALAPPLSAPALERLVAAQEQRLGVPPRPAQSLLSEFWCGIRAQSVAFAGATPPLLLLWVLDLLVPALAWMWLPLKVLIIASALAWNLLDYPLTLRGVPMRERWRVWRSHPRPVLGFGFAFATVFWIPGASILLLPVGAMAATRLLWMLLDAEPSLLPAVQRRARGLPNSSAPLSSRDRDKALTKATNEKAIS